MAIGVPGLIGILMLNAIIPHGTPSLELESVTIQGRRLEDIPAQAAGWKQKTALQVIRPKIPSDPL